MQTFSKEYALKHFGRDLAYGKYDAEYVIEGGLYLRPIETLYAATFSFFVVEDFYLFHGNGD